MVGLAHEALVSDAVEVAIERGECGFGIEHRLVQVGDEHAQGGGDNFLGRVPIGVAYLVDKSMDAVNAWPVPLVELVDDGERDAKALGLGVALAHGQVHHGMEAPLQGLGRHLLDAGGGQQDLKGQGPHMKLQTQQILESFLPHRVIDWEGRRPGSQFAGLREEGVAIQWLFLFRQVGDKTR